MGKAFQGEAQEVLSFKTSKREISSCRKRKEARVAGDQDKGQGSEGKAGPDLVGPFGSWSLDFILNPMRKHQSFKQESGMI